MGDGASASQLMFTDVVGGISQNPRTCNPIHRLYAYALMAGALCTPWMRAAAAEAAPHGAGARAGRPTSATGTPHSALTLMAQATLGLALEAQARQ